MCTISRGYLFMHIDTKLDNMFRDNSYFLSARIYPDSLKLRVHTIYGPVWFGCPADIVALVREKNNFDALLGWARQAIANELTDVAADIKYDPLLAIIPLH